MAWFWRRSRRAKNRKAANDEGSPGANRPPSRAATAPARVPSRRRSRRKRRGSNQHDGENPKTKDFALGRAPATDPGLGINPPPDMTALPGAKELRRSPHLRPATTEYADIPYNFTLPAGSHTSIPSARERGKLQRPLSLRNKRNTTESLPRRKSSKRKKEDALREEEIRAMSTGPRPKERPPSYNNSGLLRQDSKKMKNGLNRRFERPTSEVSVPTQDSIHSSMSGTSDPTAFRISALAMFAPRPTIRYTITPHNSNTNQSTDPAQGDSPRNKFKVTRETIKESRYIDALADDLDATALRELMDRDQRRRAKKKELDFEKAQRKLSRRAEKQKAEEQKKAKVEAKVEAEEADVGLGIEKTPEPAAETQQPEAGQQQEEEQELLHTHEGTFLDDHSVERKPEPEPESEAPLPVDEAPVESPRSETVAESPDEEPVLSTAQAVRYSHPSMSPPSSPVEPVHTQSSISQQMTDYPRAPSTAATYSDKASSDRRGSETTPRRISTLATFFRRGSLRRFGSKRSRNQPPSEVSFSNTSRESMSRQPLPAHLVGTMEPPRQLGKGVPHRTMSKFREDLPELPLSPPDSRVQSPETTVDPIPVRRGNNVPSRLHTHSPVTEESRTDSPVSPIGRSSVPVSQSLASVDSEASWLSGRPVKRNSNFRSSLGSTTVGRPQESADASYEELGMTDDEYFRRLTPSPEHRRRSANSAELLARRASSIAVLEENEVPGSPFTERPDDELIAHGSVARRPQVIQTANRVKSSAGLLNELNDAIAQSAVVEGENSPSDEAKSSPESEPKENEVVVQRARSVDFGKGRGHVRHLSAGSAKLLDIPARRQSQGSSKQGSAASTPRIGSFS